MPTTDPFTWTAQGASWVVQSWLASLTYAVVEDVAGDNGLRILMGLLTASVFALVWRLTRPTNGLLVRAGIATVVLWAGASQWSERPLLFGLIGLGLAVLAAEDGFDARWLLPIGWVWVNTHGSFPLGLAYLVVVIVGRRLDGEPFAVELRCLRWLAGGVALGAINPLGPRILLFPLELLRKQGVLQHVIEWQSPAFHSISERLFLVEVALVVVALIRRPRYRSGLVFIVFLAAALLGARNIPVASLVFVPILAVAWPDVGSLRSDAGGMLARSGSAIALAALVLVTVVRLRDPAFDLRTYPVKALDSLLEHEVDLEEVRMVAPDVVGNLLDLRDGPGHAVFYDDRFDMFPEELSQDVFALTAGGPSSLSILERRKVDLVLWPTALPLVQILRADDRWRTVERVDRGWALLCRRGADLGGDLGTC